MKLPPKDFGSHAAVSAICCWQSTADANVETTIVRLLEII